MKKIISFILIVSIIFSFRIPATQAAAPALALIGAAAIGATVVAVGGTQYAQKAGGSYSFNGSHLTREMIAYSSSSITKQTIDQIAAAQGLAQQAGGYFLGKAVTAIFDLQKAYNDDILKGYSNLFPVVENHFKDDQNILSPGDIIDPSELYDSDNCSGSFKVLSVTAADYTQCRESSDMAPTFQSDCRRIWLDVPVTPNTCSPGYIEIRVHVIKLEPSSESPTVSPVPPMITSPTASDLSGAINDAIPDNPAVANDLDQLMKDHPELWSFPDSVSVPGTMDPGSSLDDYPPAWPITPSQIQQWSATNSIAAQQALVDDLQAKVDANPNDLGLQTSLSEAKSKLDQMQATSVGDLALSEQLEAEKAEDLEISEPAVPDLELKSINLDPIKQTQGIMMGKFPFSVLSAAGSLFSVLVAPPLVPSFEIDLGITSVTIDLSKFDVFASNIRAVMSFLIYGLCGYVCLRIWSRF